MTRPAHSLDVDAEVQRRQHHLLARAQRRSRTVETSDVRPSPWSHVPLPDLVGAYNELYERDGGLVESAHEPMHGSKSGRCLLIDTQTGRWWCRSCRQAGDAAAFVMATQGWSYSQTAQWLEEKYAGLRPAQAHRRRSRRSPIAWRPL
jgi:hypothetical protein